MCTGSVVVWCEPALSKTLNFVEEVFILLLSDEQRAALLPSWSSPGSNCEIQELGHFHFGVFGLFKEASLDAFSFVDSGLLGKQLSVWPIV